MGAGERVERPERLVQAQQVAMRDQQALAEGGEQRGVVQALQAEGAVVAMTGSTLRAWCG